MTAARWAWPHGPILRSSRETAGRPEGRALPPLTESQPLPHVTDRPLHHVQTPLHSVATQDADGDLDAQYKGGVPGWLVVVEDPETLVWPDYPGNGFFMSLGNLQQDPRLGLLVPSGLLLQGLAEVVETPALVARFPAAERAVRFHVRRVARARHLAPDEQRVAALSPTFAELGLGEAVGPLA